MFEVWFKVPLFKGMLDPLRVPGLLSLRIQRPVQRQDPMDELNALFHGFSVILTPMNIAPDVRGHHPRRADRRAARTGRRQRRGHPAAADLHHVADLGDHHAVVHLLGRAVRRRHHLDPVQHTGRALVGGHHLRRLPDGAERAAPAPR